MEGFRPLASGSKGNALFLGTKKTKILIDCGLSARALENKLQEIHLNVEEIEAILITHEHIDHIAGLKHLALKRKIPVFANGETAKAIVAFFQDYPKFTLFTTGETFIFKDIAIHPFSVQHDAMDPVAFTLTFDGLKVGVCTDLGFPTTLVQKNLQECDYLVVEANHEPEMVHASPRPPIYKQRVLGKNGHLSNASCGELLKKIISAKTKKVHLAHLSQMCNEPSLAIKRVREHIGMEMPLFIAPQTTLGEPTYF